MCCLCVPLLPRFWPHHKKPLWSVCCTEIFSPQRQMRNYHLISLLQLLSVVIRSPDHDAQPAAKLPGYDGCAAASKPWSAQFPEGKHGRTNAKHYGSIPTDAIISGMDS